MGSEIPGTVVSENLHLPFMIGIRRNDGQLHDGRVGVDWRIELHLRLDDLRYNETSRKEQYKDHGNGDDECAYSNTPGWTPLSTEIPVH